LTDLFEIYKNEMNLVEVTDFLVAMGLQLPGAPQSKLQFMFLVWNDIAAAPIISKVKMAYYFDLAGFEAAETI
jgi:hypothetical protein